MFSSFSALSCITKPRALKCIYIQQSTSVQKQDMHPEYGSLLQNLHSLDLNQPHHRKKPKQCYAANLALGVGATLASKDHEGVIYGVV